MRKKIIGIVVFILVLTTLFPLGVSAGDSEDPEVKDRTLDVRLFGFFPLFLQFPFRYIDIVSTWMYEDEDHPEYLYISLQLMDLKDSTEKYNAIYVVSWMHRNIFYSASVHIFSSGPSELVAGRTDDQGNDYVDCVVCDGVIDTSNHLITWIIPKEAIGNPSADSIITHITPFTDLRYPEESVIPMIDLFKDLVWNALLVKDYHIQY